MKVKPLEPSGSVVVPEPVPLAAVALGNGAFSVPEAERWGAYPLIMSQKSFSGFTKRIFVSVLCLLLRS